MKSVLIRSRIRHSTAFAAGFLLGQLCFIAANAWSYWHMVIPCEDCGGGFGFPFDWYRVGGYIGTVSMIWSGLVADVIIVLFVSIGSGWISQRFFSSRNRLTFEEAETTSESFTTHPH
ncbi:MAG TPA: hypothetical protein VFD58_15870 [Blastocatellia bacterium]|nr:hypothetical protein [Blastocatellia bacterium]